MNRRAFMKSALALGSATVLPMATRKAFAEAAKDPLVGKTWPEWKKGHFQLHAIYTGVAESMFLIYPDGTTMLLDCGDHAAIHRGDLAVPVLPGGDRHAGEWIARYVMRVNPAKTAVDYMVLSHFHSDHSGCMVYHAGVKDGVPLSGFGEAMTWLTFKKAVDRGYPNYDDPIPFGSGERLGSKELMDRVYGKLRTRDKLTIEGVRLGATDQYQPTKDKAACNDFQIKNIAGNGKIVMPDGSIRDCYAEYIARRHPRLLNENGMSIGMIVSYGKFKLFTAGDFSDVLVQADGTQHWIEDDLAEAVPHVNVAKVNHHGHKAVTEKLAAALAPRVWLNCVWDQLHNTPDTMERIDRGYPGERTYCPGIMPAERRWQDKDAKWMKDVAKESYEGSHVVVDVPPGGETYTVNFIKARDESMTVSGVMHFES